ncbi:ATP-binding protein [Starkeya koreensis]|uniref:ATP-binding protein n=1 Tax=Ancylobacter koreensis TaxID=266121 RepID=A0ABT0DQM8_9HYPH|nr:ATP-binding protein [Ancylobacter koreensis]MCK0209586.1 ATP-binding protein [Ancylobacter koreensis]
MADHELDICLANEIGKLETLAERLEAYVEAEAIPPTPAYRLQLAADEFFNNAVDYGYPDGRAGEIALRVRRAGNVLEAIFSDDGNAFDPFQAPAPDIAGSLEERRIGGLGVHLVRTLADSVAYRREDGRNVVTLTFSLAATPQGSAPES